MNKEVICGRCGEKISIEFSELELIGNSLGVRCENCGKSQIIGKSLIGEDRYKEIRVDLSSKKEAERKAEDPIYKSTDPREIMHEIVTRKFLNLTPAQVDEFMSVVDDYEGSIVSPEQFKRILQNFKGVSPEKAGIAAESYVMRLQKSSGQLSLAAAEKLGFGFSPNYGRFKGRERDEFSNNDEVVEAIKKGFGGLKNSNISSDVFQKPLEKILLNMADTTGITSRIMRIFFTGIEEQVKRDPTIIGDAREWIPQLPKLLKAFQSETEEKEEVEESGDLQPRTIEKDKSIFGELDAYFEGE